MKKFDTFQAFARGAKSLVAILLVMLMAVGNLFADQVTFTFSEQEYTNNQEMIALSPIAIDNNVNVSFSKGTGSTTPKYLTNGTAVRAYGGNTMTIAAAQDVEISSVNIIFGSSDGTNAISVDNGTYADGSWSGNANTIVFTIGGTSGHRRIAGLTVTYTVPSTPATVAAPAFTPAAGTYTAVQSVTLATTTEGATIYYTVDGTEPTAESLIYQGAISVNENMTIKAIAILGEDQSTVATANYVINLPLTVTNIAAFKALDINEVATITGDVVVLGQYPNYLFVQDATGALVIYGSTSYNYNAGDVISGGINGKRAVYNGMNQMSNPGSFTAGVAGTPVEPVVVSAADLIANYVTYESKLVTIENVELAANHTFTASGADRGVDVTQGESTITVYDQFKVITGETVSAGAKTVTGYLAIYVNNNTTRYEIFPRGAEDITDYVAPIQPLDLDSIATLPYAYNFDEGTDPYFMIDNGEAVNAWYIGQAQGFDNNKLYISSNGGTTNKYDVTKASNVMAYRTVVIPETGAILSFDYRVYGQAGYDYLKVNLVKGGTTTEIATLQGENEWTSFSYDISGEMAGEVCIQFNWVNNASAGSQFPAAIDNISVIETPCSQPTHLTANMDSTTAVITWVAVEGQTAWNFQYKLANHSEWYTVPATETTVTLTDLQGNSNYDMRVQAVCGENTSAWTTGTFAVACQTEEITVTPTDLVIGTGTSTTSYIFPGYYGWQYSAILYDMNNAGPINSIAFYLNSASTTSGSSMTVWVKAVPSDYALAASNTFATMVDGAQQIYDGAPDFSTAGWITFPVNDFTLAEGQDLLVLVRGVGCSTSGGCSKSARYTSTSNKMWYKLQDSSDPGQSVTGTLSSYRPNITINMDVTVVTCDDQIACVAPTDLEIYEITANSAVLTWTAGSADETAFIVEYMAEGATEWTSVDVNDTTYTLTELAQLTNYSVRVKANCGTNNWSEVITASFRTYGICTPVTNLETANVSNTTTLTWTAGGEETAWLVQFKPATAGDDEWTSIEVSLIPMTTFGGLQGNTDYEVRVKALCDPNDTENQSEWVTTSFHSGCAAFDVPFTEEFPTNTMPTCWENQDFHFASSGYAYSYTNGAELISPAINIPAENSSYLTFEVRGAGSYSVLASYRGTRADRFAEIYTGTAPNQNATVIVALDDLYKGRAVNFKIVNNSTSYQYFYYVKVNQCPFVATDLTTGTVTDTTIDVAWSADEAVTNFQVQYGEQGFTLGEGTIIDVTGDTATTVNGLVFETLYDFYVRVVCEGDNGAWVGPVTASTALSCSDPENLTAVVENDSYIYASWTPGEWGTPVQYNVRYKAAGEEEYTTTTVIPVDMPSYTPFVIINGLQSMTTYEIGVQSICGVDKESDWVTTSVTTPCMPVSMPYEENFDSYTGTTTQSTMPIPNCWTRKYTGSSTTYGAGIYNSTTYAVSGSNSLRMYNYYTTSTSTSYGDIYVVLPKVDANINTVMVSFDAKKYNSTTTSYYSLFEIGVVTDNTNPQGTFTSYRTLSATSASTANKMDIPFDTYNGADGYIAFRVLKSAKPEGYTSTYGYNYTYIDNLVVGPIPTCFVPTIAVSGTEATITPNANGNPAQSYNLKIGEVTANTTSTTVDLSTLFTLEANTDYTIRVQAVCGDSDESEWSESLTFRTPCLAVDLPVYEDFEGTVPPECWTSYKVSGSGSYNWASTTTAHGGSHAAYVRDQSSTTIHNLVTPKMNIPAEGAVLTFWMKRESNYATKYEEGVKVLYCANENGTGATELTHIHRNYTLQPVESAAGWYEYTVTVPAGQYYVIFQGINEYGGSSTIDDISIIVAPSCGVPSLSVAGTDATITPNSIGTPVSYNLQIGDVTVNTTSTTVDLSTLFTLEANTEYEVSVQAVCGDNDESEWSAPVAFTTPACSDPCIYTIEMVDDYGDGWNGNAINVKLNGSIVETLTIADGAAQTSTVSVCDGTVSFEWVIGSYSDEASFTIKDATSATLYTCTDGSTLSSGEFYSTYCGVIPTCFAPAQLTASEIEETSAVITWVDDNNQGLYALQYKAEGDANWTDVANIDTTYYLLNNLTASTEYVVKVKAICGTDDESDYSQSIAFRTNCIGGGNIEIAGTGSNQNYIPVGNFYNYSYTQQILTAEEIGATGTISSISFEYAYTTATTSKNNVKIYMANTDKSEFASTSDWIAASDMQQVYQGNLNCSEGWNEFVLNNTFAYAGGNLAIIVEDNSGAYNGSGYVFATTTTSEYRALTWQQDGAAYAGQEGTRRLLHNNIRLTVCPEAIDLAVTGMNTIADACDVEGAITINVKNCGYEPVSGFTAYYQVNEETPVSETVTLATPIAITETASYTFNNLPVFTADESIITAWIELENDAVETNNTVVSAPITALDPIAVPYEEAFAGLTINHGWNPIDANNDGITMNLDNEIYYTFNDEAAADDWMMSPCIEMAAGNYTITYDYKANSSLTESFEVFYGNGAHVADMTNTVATHTFNNTTYETVTTTITIPADGIYNFGFHATSLAGNLGFSIDNFKVYPVNNVVVTYAENGTVTPNGVVAVNYGENLTLNIVPDPMYHVGGIEVDGVQVVPEDGTGANFMLYTLENITEPHNVFVDFKLEFHIFKSVENYKADLYSELGGKFVNTELAVDTTINPNPFTVNMVADPHYHLAGLTVSPMVPDSPEDVFAGVVNNGDGTYSYTIDTLVVANYYVNATFRRDTVAINYNVLTGKGYANDSELLNAGDTYTTWVDYPVYNDVDTTVTFAAGDNYHIVDVFVNGESQGRINSYTFENVQTSQTVDIKYGYKVDAFVSNYNTYDDIQTVMGTIAPETQYIAEYDPMTVTGTVEEHFHLYQLLVNGVNRIDEVVFGADPHYYSFTMDSIADNYTIEAVVKVDTFAVIYNIVAGQGYADESDLLVAPTTYYNIHNYGDDWYSNIIPATGYAIENVTLDGQNLYTANNYQFNYLVTSHVFDVTFAPVTYNITTNAYGQGTVSDGMTFTFDPENPVDYEFVATPAEGYYVSAVFINGEAQDLTGVEGEYTTTIDNVADNYVIDAHFSIFTYTMTAEAANGGTITPAGTQIVNYGTDMTYEINANEGWYIASTDIDGITTNYTQDDAEVTLTVPYTAINADHSVSVTFAQFMYTITGTVGANGTVNGATVIDEELVYGSNYAMTITPAANYQVADVVVDGTSVGAVNFYEFINITADHTVDVTFEAIMYTLTATSNTEGCTITPATTTVQAGSNVSYTVTAAAGYHLLNVIANGEEVTVTNNAFTITDVQSDYIIYANFAPNNVTVTVDQPAHATITPGTMTYTYGATPSYMIVPETGYNIVSVTAGNAVITVTYNNGIGTFTLPALHQDITLTATTEAQTFTITVTQGANGTITPGTQTNVTYGSDKTFTIAANNYYAIVDVIVDGSSRGPISSYTFHNVTGDHTITAIFEEDCNTPTNLVALNITTTSADLNWTGTADSYEVRYRAADQADYTIQTVTGNTLALTNLTPNTLYAWGVRALCGSNLSSEWVDNSFTTKLDVGIANAEFNNVKVYSYQNTVYIVNEDGVAISNVDIYDIYGKQVYTGKVLSSPEVISLDVANGNYVVRLATDKGVGVYKVSIVR